MAFGNNISHDNILYQGQGSVLVSELNDSDVAIGGFEAIGDCESVELSFETENLEVKENESGQRGILAKKIISKTGTVSIITKNFAPENLARVFLGNTTDVASAAITDEAQTAYLGKYLITDNIIDSNVVIQDDTNTVTYVEGDNYVVSDGHIFIVEDQSGAADQIADSDVLHISYTSADVAVVESLVDNEKELQIVFSGVNTCDGNKAVRTTLYKVSIDPAQARQLINSEDLGTIEITGTLLTSTAITGSTKSKLYKEELVK